VNWFDCLYGIAAFGLFIGPAVECFGLRYRYVRDQPWSWGRWEAPRRWRWVHRLSPGFYFLCLLFLFTGFGLNG